MSCRRIRRPASTLKGSQVGNAARWLALLVQSGGEGRAVRALRRERFGKAYWPRYKAMVKARLRGGPRVTKLRSVIPGYLFLLAEGGIDLAEMRGYTATIRGVLTDVNGKWVVFPESGRNSIDDIRRIEAALNASPVAAAQGIPFKTGQRVRIDRLDMDGTITRIDGAAQITVEARMFGRLTRVILPVAEIEAI